MVGLIEWSVVVACAALPGSVARHTVTTARQATVITTSGSA